MKFTFLLLYLLPFCISAKQHFVGPTRSASSPNALYLQNVVNDGDTINIDGTDYLGTEALSVWSQNNLTIRGINGKPHLKADGAYIQGKGIWVVRGSDITIENIEFSGAAVPDLNGAGIRCDGHDMTIISCSFHHNENGILVTSLTPGFIHIERTEFAYNGAGDGYSHNIYVNNTDRLVFQYNYTHHAYIGHCIKSRAKENHILYNRIMDEEDGKSSRLIDIPNGGRSIILGNVMHQGSQAENKNLIGIGLEGTNDDNRPHLTSIMYNTMINERHSCLWVDIADPLRNSLRISSNIMAGTGDLLVEGPTIAHNVFSDINSLFFMDPASYSFVPTLATPTYCKENIQYNNDSITYIRTGEYVYDLSFKTDTNVQSYKGAFDLHETTATVDITSSSLIITPNPTSHFIEIKGTTPGAIISLYDISGQLVHSSTQAKLSVAHLPRGLYLVKSDHLHASFTKL